MGFSKNLLQSLSLASCIYVASYSASFADFFKDVSKLPSGNYIIEKSHASLTFKVSHMGLSFYTARFTDIAADLILNTKDVEKSKLTAEVKIKSVKTDYPFPKKENFDEEIGEKFFEVDKYPAAKFVATKIVKTGENKGVVTGDLTMHGVTKPVNFDVTFNGGFDSHPYTKTPAVGFSGSAKIKRSQWGMEAYLSHVGDEVELLLELEFVKK